MKIKWIVSYRGELDFEVIGRESPYNRLRLRIAPPLMGNYSEPIGLLHLGYSTLPLPDDKYLCICFPVYCSQICCKCARI
jgi:hypothetical protein